MNHNQTIRYSRHISLPEIGKKGQEKLLKSKVLAIGSGGLGSPLLLYLAASGVGEIGIVDDDVVDLSNLQRQVLFEVSDINRLKTESALDALHDLNPDIKLNCHNVRLDSSNADDIIKNYDIVADGSDNFDTRFLVNDKCFEHSKILVSAAVQGFSGQLAVFKDGRPCYRCLCPDDKIEDVSCSQSGVLGAAAGVIGTMQAVEIIKQILKIGEDLTGKLVIYDALKSDFRKVSLRRNKECICCGAVI